MNKMMVFIDLFRKGKSLLNVGAWKAGQITANMIGAAILAAVAVLRSFGYDLPISTEDAMLIGGGIIAAVNVILTSITSKAAGILPAKQPEQDLFSIPEPTAGKNVQGEDKASSQPKEDFAARDKLIFGDY